MLKRLAEYFTFGFGRPLGVVWATEKAYFDVRRKFPGKGEHVYLRLAVQSRYPEKNPEQLNALLAECHDLEDAMVAALVSDFSPGIAAATRINVLSKMPPCARCGKYKALSTTDDLCYGCRKYHSFSACTTCHLYWDDSRGRCSQCGATLWRITDGPGVPMTVYEMTTDQPSPPQPSIQSQMDEWTRRFLDLAMEAESLAGRCEKVWLESQRDRQAYRAIRQIDPIVARDMVLASEEAEPADPKLIDDLDAFFGTACDFYLDCSDRDRDDLRSVIGSSKQLAGNLFNYAGRTSGRFRENGNLQFLLRALAAFSIDNGQTGREFDFILQRLWEYAAVHRVDAANAFLTIAQKSEPEVGLRLESFVKSRY
jgi:hypothetical protein